MTLNLSLVDYDDNPVKQADTEIAIKYDDGFSDKFHFSTDDLGLISATLKPSAGHIRKPCIDYLDIDLSINKPEFYIINKNYDTYKLGANINLKLNFSSPNDYFTKEFQKNKNSIVRQRIKEFIDYLALKSILSNCILKTRSVGLSEFKSKKHITFKFESLNVYNSIRSNKYDIGKILFDEVIRKVLEPLNLYLFDYSGFLGFDLTVIGKSKDFVNEEEEKNIEYRFIIPKEIVTKYKNKDISGQTVLDKSIILMDDERIELKLQ